MEKPAPLLDLLPMAWRQIIAPSALALLPALDRHLQAASDKGETVFPPHGKIFAALESTAPENISAVILGQDPYHGAGQAMGLSFSVPDGVRLPPSLRNIYKEIAQEYDAPMPKSGDLSSWARQGVLLLNATLTVREGQAGAHQNKGWEDFTDAVIAAASQHAPPSAFMLWGSYAQKKNGLIDAQKHLALQAPHPSPLSAHRGFLGCGHFKTANAFLMQHGRTEIDWLSVR